ncbi:Pre-mRNA-processing factor 19, partial [Gonapodya sp. JEL0774]
MQEQGVTSFITGGKDATVRIWELDESRKPVGKFAVKDAVNKGSSVTGVTVHASGAYWVASGSAGEWSFGDYGAGRVVKKVKGDVESITSAAFHPDGLILGTPTPSSVLLWDVKSCTVAASFPAPQLGVNGSCCFSENGYHLATIGGGGKLKIWDLRKLQVGKEVDVPDGTILSYDYSGQYLAVGGGNEIKIFATKTWEVLTTFESTGADLASVKYGPDAKYLAAAGGDGVVKVWA